MNPAAGVVERLASRQQGFHQRFPLNLPGEASVVPGGRSRRPQSAPRNPEKTLHQHRILLPLGPLFRALVLQLRWQPRWKPGQKWSSAVELCKSWLKVLSCLRLICRWENEFEPPIRRAQRNTPASRNRQQDRALRWR